MSGRVIKAYEFAAKAHGSQKRKYTGEPYVNHPFEVMGIVASVPHTEDMLCAALLHDVLEDTDATEQEIAKEFGESVCEMVKWLTDVSKPEDGNRAKRKEIDRNHIANAPVEAKTIKLADLISNSKSIMQHDESFAKVYLQEKKLLLEVLQDGDPMLLAKAQAIVNANLMTDVALDKAAKSSVGKLQEIMMRRWKTCPIDLEELTQKLVESYKKESEVVIPPPEKR
jgi:DNA-binding phage protein